MMKINKKKILIEFKNFIFKELVMWEYTIYMIKQMIIMIKLKAVKTKLTIVMIKQINNKLELNIQKNKFRRLCKKRKLYDKF